MGVGNRLRPGPPRFALRRPRFPPLRAAGANVPLCRMIPADLAQTAMDLSVEDRLELARRLVESVVTPAALNEAVAEGIRRIEDVAAGRTSGLTEEQFRSALR